MSESLNIKNLPVIDEVQPGDYLLVEVPTGSRILDFKDFIITKDNISFASELSGFGANITALLSRTDTLTSALFYGDQDLLAHSLSSRTWLSAGIGVHIGVLNIQRDGDMALIYNHLSAAGVLYASVGNSDQWNGAWFYTNANSAHWNQAWTETNAYSATWRSTYSTTLAESADWQSVYATVRGTSATWGGGGATEWYENGDVVFLGAGVGSLNSDKVGINTETPNEQLTIQGHLSAYGNMYVSAGNSDQWMSAYSTVNGTSALWESATRSGCRLR